jgi:hypothetical protein
MIKWHTHHVGHKQRKYTISSVAVSVSFPVLFHLELLPWLRGTFAGRPIQKCLASGRLDGHPFSSSPFSVKANVYASADVNLCGFIAHVQSILRSMVQCASAW